MPETLCVTVAAIDMAKENFDRQKQLLLADLGKLKEADGTANQSNAHLYSRISKMEYPISADQQGSMSYFLRDSYDGNEKIAEQVFQLLGKY